MPVSIQALVQQWLDGTLPFDELIYMLAIHEGDRKQEATK